MSSLSGTSGLPDGFSLIYQVASGSQAYGLATASSDLDIRGVCIPPPRYLVGLTPFEQWEAQSEEGETVVFALSKFVRLALACNPNIIEMLYTPQDSVMLITEAGRQLVAARDLFLTRQAGRTFGEYAISQLRRLERHHRWLVDPPDHLPTQEEFGGRAAEGRFKFPDHDAQRAYQNALKHWNQYQVWVRNRNPERAELERLYGYDTKHAMHLLRLLKMGVEILSTGQVHVYRPDREWLLAVRGGLLGYEELLTLAAEYEMQLRELRQTSALPESPDVAAAEHMVVELQGRFLIDQLCGPEACSGE
jgi:predicted nucleotidyltransferase